MTSSIEAAKLDRLEHVRAFAQQPGQHHAVLVDRQRRLGRSLRTAWVARPIAYLVGLSGLAYLVQGWVVGSEGFSPTHTILILVAWVVTLGWMIWLAVVAWRMPASVAAARTDQGAGGTATSGRITDR